MKPRRTFASRLSAVFGLDVRSLALLRIGLGALLLVDLAVRGPDVEGMYSDAGFAPVNLVRSLQPPGTWSLHLLNGSTWYQGGLFIAAAVAALALTIGYRTRLATIASWALVCSLHARLPVVINAGDTLLRVLLFWGFFLPLGAVWSVDSRRRPLSHPPRVVSIGSVAFILQLAIVYWMAGGAKLSDAWLQGDALHNIFSFGLYSLPLGETLAGHRELTQWMTPCVVWLELAGPCLLFVPWFTAPLRMLLVAGFLLFHVGIALTVTVGLFSYVAMTAWLAMLPSEFWRGLGLRPPRADGNEADLSSLASPSDDGNNIAAACCLAALALIAYLNARTALNIHLPNELDRAVRIVANATGLHQAWAVFGEPPDREWWYVYQVTLNDGRELDVLSRGRGTEHDRPAHPAQQFANHRWRKLHLRLAVDSGAAYRQPLAEYICRRWNETHPEDEQIARLDLYCCSRPIGSTADPLQYTRQSLAEVMLNEEGGNFAEALREVNALPQRTQSTQSKEMPNEL